MSWFRWFSLVFLLASCCGLSPTFAQEKSVLASSPAWKSVAQVAQKAVDQKQIAGAVVLVYHRGAPVVYEAVGLADIETQRPMARDAIFRIASMTKPLTSTVIMQLVDEGKLKLDDPVSKFIPEFENPQVLLLREEGKAFALAPAERPITIAQLLTHTAGVTYRMANRPQLGRLYAEADIVDGLAESPITLSENIRRLGKLPLRHQPGEAWTYGLNTDILGRVIEVVTGRSLADAMQERLFVPLAMTDTGFRVPEEKRARLAAFHSPTNDKTLRKLGEGIVRDGQTIYSASFATADENRYQSGGAGLTSTATDYGRFLRMLLNRGELDGKRVLQAETVDAMTRHQIGDLKCEYAIHGDGFGYGFGVVTGRENPPSPASRGAYSWGGMFHTFFWVDPKEELAALVMPQLYPWGNSTLWKDFQDEVYRVHQKNFLDSTAKKPVRVSEVTLHGDMDCFQVETPAGKFVYGKRGAGFASIIDREGNDWISYRPGDKSKGEYRGLPKCGQPTKFFHCGYGYGEYKTDNVFTSTVTVNDPDHVRIESETLDKKSACAWDFYATHATMTLLRIDAPTFWFLYEGTPGGSLDAERDFVVRPDKARLSLDQAWTQTVPWVCFGASETKVGLLCVNHQGPETDQSDSYVSWPFEKEADGSFREMTVFGFGRKGYRELVKHVPDLKRLPAQYSIALLDKAEHTVARERAEAILNQQSVARLENRSEPSGPSKPAGSDEEPPLFNELRRVAMAGQGKPDRGKLVFNSEKAKCSTCHKVAGTGGEVGSDLSQIGGKFDRTHLIEAILNPSGEILQGYQTSVVETTDGRVFTGIIKAENATTIALMDAERKLTTIAIAEIESREFSKVSLMPAGLGAGVTPEEFGDLIAYLQSLRTGRAPTPGEGTTGPLTLPDGFKAEVVAKGFTGATALEVAPDGRIIVAEQTGALKMVRDGKLLSQPLTQLPVETTWERGLLGVTVAPDFPKSPHIYVLYVTARPFVHHVVSRLTVTGQGEGNFIVVGSEKILFEGDDQTKIGGAQPAGHQGGGIHFGPDGKLYFAFGDQTAGQPAQQPNSLLGRIHRINPDGTIPEDNPYYTKSTGKYRAALAMGLRNPYTFAIDAATAKIFVNDVGGKAEEINEIVPGANYGWPTVDHGHATDEQFRAAIHHYPTACIAGGAFAPKDWNWPATYQGKYFFGDFNHGTVRTIDPENPAKSQLFASGLRRPSDLRIGPDGNLYVLIRDAWVMDNLFKGGTGALLKISYGK